MDNAMVFIAALLSEAVVVVSDWQGEEWTGSTASERPEMVDLAPGHRVRVRSRQGTRNQDVEG